MEKVFQNLLLERIKQAAKFQYLKTYKRIKRTEGYFRILRIDWLRGRGKKNAYMKAVSREIDGDTIQAPLKQ